MNIPLDRLYHYIQNVVEEIYGERVIIYRFFPHGSKNISDLINLNQDQLLAEHNEWYKKTVSPGVWCNDQEPLNYQYYKVNTWQSFNLTWVNLLKAVGEYSPAKNLNYHKTIFEKGLLLHSEKRSSELEKYRCDNELIPVYYWSHALIARDWFRYAQHVGLRKQVKKPFLVYNRAWSGTREYRLRFAELLIHLNLQEHCKISINPVEPELGIHYELHTFKNPQWRPQTVLENYFPTSVAHSHYSADFDIEDYAATDIEVVLETLFDDSRLHLTEKSLRPIACAQPFILAGTHGSLEYLRSYGFKTFGNVWDESYDLVKDPAERLIQIAELMKYISNWSPDQREHNLAEAQSIADYNKQHFFSDKFFNQIIEELKTNLSSAFEELSQCNNYAPWIDKWSRLIEHVEICKFLNTNQYQKSPTMDTVKQVLQLAKNKLIEQQ